jgi:hypothetical protein
MLRSLQAIKNSLFHRALLSNPALPNKTSRPSNGLGPFSGRTIALLVFILYLLLEPVHLGADVVSASLAYGFLALLFTTTVALITQGYFMKRALSIAVHPPERAAVSGETARVVINLTPLRILPGCRLDLSLQTKHPGAQIPTIRVTGFSVTEHRSYADIMFPHRGSWMITSVRCELIDALGLVRFSWDIPQSVAVEVIPPPASETRLPILSSTQRAGDLVLDTNNRNGDPFDIKPYHPSDGVKKIVWKAYAKRGELLSRHPEASMTPEGHVVMVVMAEKEDDLTCSHALAYIRNLEDLSLDIVVGCLGRGLRDVARDTASAESLLVQSAWDSSPLSLERLQQEISNVTATCQSQHTGLIIAKILIFCAGEHAATAQSRSALYELGAWMESQGIEPIFCLTPPKSLALDKNSSRLTTAIVSLALRSAARPEQAASASEYQSFLTECLRKQWEVYV